MIIYSKTFSAAAPANALLFALACGILSVRHMTGDFDLSLNKEPTEVAAQAPQLPVNPNIPVTPFDGAITFCALEYRIDPLLLKAIIAVESDFNNDCVSRAGASGLMQLMPATARRLDVRNIFDPHENIHGGARHLKYLLTRFKNDLPKSLAAYNAGERPVLRFHGIPPYRETQRYVTRVLKIYDSYRSMGG